MSISSAINTANAILSNTGQQTSVLSTNIQNSKTENYNRRSAVTTVSIYGSATITLERTQNLALFKQKIAATSEDSAHTTLLAGVEAIRSTLGGNEYELSPSAYMAKLKNSLQEYAGTPSNFAFGQVVMTSAADVVTSLNDASKAVQELRTQADGQIDLDVKKLNQLLSDFKAANDEVVKATALKTDPSTPLDVRDGLLSEISKIIGISTLATENNSLNIYASDGITLFDKVPRLVTFSPQSAYSATSTGNSVYIDGVVLKAGNSSDTTAKGSLQANLQVRDIVAPAYQNQLDEVARGLITAYAETSTTLPATTLPGLFTWSGGTVPPGTAIVKGLAAAIKVNPLVTTPTMLRDGGINGTGYVKSNAGASYSLLLDTYANAVSQEFTFLPGAGIDTSSSILDFSSNSIGWLEDFRSNATTSAESSSALLSRSEEAYSNATGVSVDEELTLMLDVEQSYKAAAKLVATIDQMLQALLDVAG